MYPSANNYTSFWEPYNQLEELYPPNWPPSIISLVASYLSTKADLLEFSLVHPNWHSFGSEAVWKYPSFSNIDSLSLFLRLISQKRGHLHLTKGYNLTLNSFSLDSPPAPKKFSRKCLFIRNSLFSHKYNELSTCESKFSSSIFADPQILVNLVRAAKTINKLSFYGFNLLDRHLSSLALVGHSLTHLQIVGPPKNSYNAMVALFSSFASLTSLKLKIGSGIPLQLWKVIENYAPNLHTLELWVANCKYDFSRMLLKCRSLINLKIKGPNIYLGSSTVSQIAYNNRKLQSLFIEALDVAVSDLYSVLGSVLHLTSLQLINKSPRSNNNKPPEIISRIVSAKLRTLVLFGLDVPTKSYNMIFGILKKLDTISISNSPRLTNGSLIRLSETTECLLGLSVVQCPNISDSVVSVLFGNHGKSLVSLNFDNILIRDPAAFKLSLKRFHSVEDLCVSGEIAVPQQFQLNTIDPNQIDQNSLENTYSDNHYPSQNLTYPNSNYKNPDLSLKPKRFKQNIQNNSMTDFNSNQVLNRSFNSSSYNKSITTNYQTFSRHSSFNSYRLPGKEPKTEIPTQSSFGSFANKINSKNHKQNRTVNSNCSAFLRKQLTSEQNTNYPMGLSSINSNSNPSYTHRSSQLAFNNQCDKYNKSTESIENGGLEQVEWKSSDEFQLLLLKNNQNSHNSLPKQQNFYSDDLPDIQTQASQNEKYQTRNLEHFFLNKKNGTTIYPTHNATRNVLNSSNRLFARNFYPRETERNPSFNSPLNQFSENQPDLSNTENVENKPNNITPAPSSAVFDRLGNGPTIYSTANKVYKSFEAETFVSNSQSLDNQKITNKPITSNLPISQAQKANGNSITPHTSIPGQYGSLSQIMAEFGSEIKKASPKSLLGLMPLKDVQANTRRQSNLQLPLKQQQPFIPEAQPNTDVTRSKLAKPEPGFDLSPLPLESNTSIEEVSLSTPKENSAGTKPALENCTSPLAAKLDLPTKIKKESTGKKLILDLSVETLHNGRQTLKVYKGNDPYILASEFCLKYKMADLTAGLHTLILKKLEKKEDI